jgi:hypothetical protein
MLLNGLMGAVQFESDISLGGGQRRRFNEENSIWREKIFSSLKEKNIFRSEREK